VIHEQYRVVTHIGMRMSPDEGPQIARPHVELVEIRGRLHTEVAAVFILFLQGLIVATHALMINREAWVSASALNMMSDLGMPMSVKI
jgi:hypothetical protein